MQNEALTKLFHLFTHDLCVPLAIQLHIRTGKPIYAIYDPNAPVMRWGVHYWHYFVKLEEDKYLSAAGLLTGEETISLWAKLWKDPTILANAAIVPHHPTLEGTGDKQIDRCIDEMYGDQTTIQPHTVQFADMLLRMHDIPC